MISALVGGPPKTTYGENIGVLAITRVYSVYVLAGAAVLAIYLRFYWKNNSVNSNDSNTSYGRCLHPLIWNYRIIRA